MVRTDPVHQSKMFEIWRQRIINKNRLDELKLSKLRRYFPSVVATSERKKDIHVSSLGSKQYRRIADRYPMFDIVRLPLGFYFSVEGVWRTNEVHIYNKLYFKFT